MSYTRPLFVSFFTLIMMLGAMSVPAYASGVLDGEWLGVVKPGPKRMMNGDKVGCGFLEVPARMTVLNGRADLRFDDVRKKQAIFEGVVGSSGNQIDFHSGKASVAEFWGSRVDHYGLAKKFTNASGTVEQDVFTGDFKIRGSVESDFVTCKFSVRLERKTITSGVSSAQVNAEDPVEVAINTVANSAVNMDGEWACTVISKLGKKVEDYRIGCGFIEVPATMHVVNGKVELKFHVGLRYNDEEKNMALFEGNLNSTNNEFEFHSGKASLGERFGNSFERIVPARKFLSGQGKSENNIFTGEFLVRGLFDGFRRKCKFTARLERQSTTVAQITNTSTVPVSGTSEDAQSIAELKSQIDKVRQDNEAETQRLMAEEQKRQQEMADLKKELQLARLEISNEADRIAEQNRLQEEARIRAEELGSAEIQQQILALSKLQESGLITQDEFLEKKTAVLNAFLGLTETKETVVDEEPDIFADMNFGKYYALIIGNNDHQMLPDLITAVPDARDISRILEENYGFTVKTLYDATRRDIFKGMQSYRNKLTKDDNLLIYYAGHGYLDNEAARGYWLPVDADPNFKSDWISNADITDALRSIKSRHVMVIADSCYSGTLIRSANIQIDNSLNRKALIERLVGKRSRTVMTSGGLEPVMDGGGGGHSVFANALISVLEENKTVLEAQQIFNLLRPKVIVNSDQTPEYSDVRKAGHDGGDFLFVRQNKS